MPHLLQREPTRLTKQADEHYRRQLEAAYGGAGMHAPADVVCLPAETPRFRRRQCTDLYCVGALAAFVYGLWVIHCFSRERGDLAKLTRGYDWKGDICGVDAAVKDTPLLFWCAPGSASPGSLNLLDAVCLKTCPSGPGTSSWCPGEARRYGRTEDEASNKKEIVVGTVRNLTVRPDYATVEAFGYCFPREDVYLLNRIMQETHISSLTKQVFLACHGAVESWHFLICVAIVSTCVGYAFLGILWSCYSTVIYGTFAICHLCLLTCSGALTYSSFHDEHSFFANYFEPQTARIWTWSCASIAWAVWLLFAAFCCCNRDAIRMAIDSVRQTCEVITQIPSLLLQPFFHSAVVLVCMLSMLYGFALLLSVGEVVPDLVPVQEGGLQVQGLQRSIRFTGWQWVCIAYWVFGQVWVFETLHALGQFAISHAVVIFACFDVVEKFPMLHGYAAGICFHLGSLALGGFIVGSLKFVVIVLSFVVKQAGDETGGSNLVARAACCCCITCVACIERVLSMVNNLIYTDIALRAVGYADAAGNVVRTAAINPGAYVALKGSAAAVRVLGIGTIAGLGTFMSYQVLSSTPLHESLDVVFPSASSMLVTSNVMGTTMAAGAICFFIGKAFMTVFCQTTHTLMYCKLLGVAENIDEEEPCSPRSLLFVG